MENDFIFIKGKNPELSKFEITSYLSCRSIRYDILEDAEEFTIIRFLDEVDLERMMRSLGGTLKIGQVLAEGPLKNINILDRLDMDLLLEGKDDKFAFGVSVYSEKEPHEVYDYASKYFKRKFKEMGLKANFFGVSHTKPQLTNVEVIKKDLVKESAEILFCSGNRIYVGKTLFLHNPFEFQKRDVGRPRQRTIFSISPRLSNILINLSWAREGEILLDPFCGIGTILQEAAMNYVDIRGIDADPECIESCKENLKWLSNEYSLGLSDIDKKIMKGDTKRLSEYFKEDSVDCIATEPYLGPPLRNKPTIEEAKKILEEIRVLYEKALAEMYKVIKHGKKIAVISPRIRITESKSADLEFASIAEGIGFKIVSSFIDAESRHRTIREIFVIEKP
jgi:tRNA G10  N-methylase Trm11